MAVQKRKKITDECCHAILGTEHDLHEVNFLQIRFLRISTLNRFKIFHSPIRVDNIFVFAVAPVARARQELPRRKRSSNLSERQKEFR